MKRSGKCGEKILCSTITRVNPPFLRVDSLDKILGTKPKADLFKEFNAELKDTDDDAGYGPYSYAETDREDGLAVHARLHVVGEQSLGPNVQSPHAEGHHGPHDVHGEQRGFLKHRQLVCIKSKKI